MERNYALIIIGYYIQLVEAGYSKEESCKRSTEMLDRVKEKMTEEDHKYTIEYLERLSKI